MKNKLFVHKGCFGYMQSKRTITIIKTVIFFAVSLSLYFAGIKATGSNKNLLTVVAILGCLPASKSAVNMIMFLRYKGCTEDIASQLPKEPKGLYPLYDMIFTSYEKNYEIHHMAINDKVICAYTARENCDVAACEQHLQNMLTQNGLKNITVKVFQDFPKYKNRLSQLEELSELGTAAAEIKQLMLEISL